MSSDGSSVETLEPAELARLITAGQVLLVDVREPNEYQMERIPGALLFPLSSFDATALPKDGERRLVFHCAGGKRSLDACRRRLTSGVAHATHLGGGIGAWKAAGLPVMGSAGECGSWTI
jgi:rhodanese-related sulfurtransferase